MEKNKKFYRYEKSITPILVSMTNPILNIYNVLVVELEFSLFKETPKGYWIIEHGDVNGLHSPKKWISKTSRKRFAYPTKKEALNSFVIRTKKRLSYLEHDVANYDKLLKQAHNLLE